MVASKKACRHVACRLLVVYVKLVPHSGMVLLHHYLLGLSVGHLHDVYTLLELVHANAAYVVDSLYSAVGLALYGRDAGNGVVVGVLAVGEVNLTTVSIEHWACVWCLTVVDVLHPNRATLLLAIEHVGNLAACHHGSLYVLYVGLEAEAVEDVVERSEEHTSE